MLQHSECPRCHAPNLGSEIVCFACGASLRPLPKRFLPAPAQAPWLLWVGLLVGLAIAGFVGYHLAALLAGYRATVPMPAWYFPAAGAALVIAGQVALVEARKTDRRWWALKRAPELPMSQVHTGDTVWLRGKVQCESPLIAPYTTAECVYYRYARQEREEGKAGWHTVERDTKCIDFEVAQENHSLYVPSGGVLFDAQIYYEGFLDPDGEVQVKVWALPVGIPVSMCGQVAGESDRPRIGPCSDELPVIATWRAPSDYVALTARRAKWAQAAGWFLTVLGALTLIASVAKI